MSVDTKRFRLHRTEVEFDTYYPSEYVFGNITDPLVSSVFEVATERGFDIEKLIKEINDKGFNDIVVLSNLPYYITSKLLNKILVNNYNIHSIVTMMQKEVGQKILKPEKKDYNFLSVILDYQYDVSIVKYVGKNSYLPRPEIDSIVLKFEKVSPKVNGDFESLIKVAECLFAQRRKTVANNLKALMKAEQINQCLECVNVLASTHIEQLKFIDIVNIANFYKNIA